VPAMSVDEFTVLVLPPRAPASACHVLPWTVVAEPPTFIRTMLCNDCAAGVQAAAAACRAEGAPVRTAPAATATRAKATHRIVREDQG
jgi:hypothetical protein